MAKKKESKQKKMNVRVDFTPMVDMMMLLITFFMLCTTLAKPQAMQLTMPAKDNDKIADENKDKAKTDLTVTIYLAPDGKLYSYIIKKAEDFGNEEFLEEVSYGKGGNGVRSIRDVLMTYKPDGEAQPPVQAILAAKKQLVEWEKKQPKDEKSRLVVDSVYAKTLNMIQKGYLNVVKNNNIDKARYEEILNKMMTKTEDPNELATTLAVNIKPLDDCTYENLVAILDEMSICAIGSYRISDINDKDRILLSKVKGKDGKPLLEAPAMPAEGAGQ
jgi:biopolymer transport protein ExbD